MNQKLPAIIGIAGFVIALGAVGDADCGTGSYILARMMIGGMMMVGGWAWAKIRAAHAGSTARTANGEGSGKNNPISVYTGEGGGVNGLGVHNRRKRV